MLNIMGFNKDKRQKYKDKSKYCYYQFFLIINLRIFIILSINPQIKYINSRECANNHKIELILLNPNE
jgi:hypothetical protein